MVEAKKAAIVRHIEQSLAKEVIADTIMNHVKTRVMSFFQGVDLDKVGTTQQDLLTIKTSIYERFADQPRTIANIASINGIPVAKYERMADKWPRYGSGKLVQQKWYTLRGEKPNPNGYTGECYAGEYIGIMFAEGEDEGQKLSRLYIDGQEKSGPPGIFSVKELKSIAAVFRIKP
ncbi:MAG: hypothetical protein A3B47_02650 [Candidatus Levybacteria bacterium RIFCSPLOWO2_01_FULL_39_24]|nr:MAG: hypothetical protein A2800_01940 [Candidatus Levybacteria bacterium RIFCSPHIGHO2_01_FULL_40_16]OGH28249.1 MAG: hypothetical protein A3E12_01910 [Candidatus Levybacteria bacterium RIFCSPHIGHO2_12_FULL_39_9]OGH46520.1 MAG: hypothetical protein A3B47_02650 [Candidatus Levybacteria bacterium RIFCSPLOWO2_01_FULL_39_24]